jgi:octaprenyl-diphosphate synthase
MESELLEKPINLADIRNCVAEDLNQVEALLRAQESDLSLTQEISAHVTRAGGKRLRPIVLLLCAKQLGYQGKHHINLAATVELVHTATLLHDDVVDNSPLRRGQDTAMQIWGNAASVLVGDYLYSRSFRLLAECENLKAVSLVADATNALAEGEILQLMHRRNLKLTEEQHLTVLACKTGKLFELSAQLACVATQACDETTNALSNYGMNLGIAFQIIDDVLDYQGQAEDIGKRVGDDLVDGNLTLPLIYALQRADAQQHETIANTLLDGSTDRLRDIQAILQATQALESAQKLAKTYVTKACVVLDHMPESLYKRQLLALAQFALNRTH